MGCFCWQAYSLNMSKRDFVIYTRNLLSSLVAKLWMLTTVASLYCDLVLIIQSKVFNCALANNWYLPCWRVKWCFHHYTTLCGGHINLTHSSCMPTSWWKKCLMPVAALRINIVISAQILVLYSLPKCHLSNCSELQHRCCLCIRARVVVVSLSGLLSRTWPHKVESYVDTRQ